MSPLGKISRMLFRAFWEGFKAPMKERYLDIILLIITVFFIGLRARRMSEISWEEIIQTITPLLWFGCIGFGVHVVRAAIATAQKIHGWPAWLELSSLTGVLLFATVWIFAITYPSLNPNAARRLSKTEKGDIVAALTPYKGQLYAIDWTPQNSEVLHFAEDIDETLQASGWQKVSYGEPWNPTGFPASLRFGNQFGVQWYISELTPPSPLHATLRTSLHSCCDITADGVRWPDPERQMDTNVIYFYIGPRFSP